MRLPRSRRISLVFAAVAGLITLVAMVALVGQRSSFVRKSEPIALYDVAGPGPGGTAMVPAPALAEMSVEDAAAALPAPMEIGLPRLAYAYKLGFRLSGARIAAAQEAHLRLCERMGPARCHLVALERGAADDAEARGMLRVRVASDRARGFSDALVKVIAEAGGRTIATSVAAEDVSKQIVDAEARIRQRELLVSRLTEILRSRSGKVAELVEAERSVAQAQEELDQTKGWLAELRARVAMSEFEVTYAAVAAQTSPATAGNQIAEAAQGSGAAFLVAMRALLTLLIYLAPWGLVAALLFLAGRVLIRRHAPIRDRDEPAAG